MIFDPMQRDWDRNTPEQPYKYELDTHVTATADLSATGGPVTGVITERGQAWNRTVWPHRVDILYRVLYSVPPKYDRQGWFWYGEQWIRPS